MSRLNWFGISLQVVGLVAAAVLLGRLREAVTRQEVVPFAWARSAWWRLRRLARWVLRRRPEAQTLSVGPASVTLSAAGSLRVENTERRMPDGLALEEQVAWMIDYVRDVERRHNALATEVGRRASEQADAVQAARKHAEDLMRDAVDQVRSEFRQLVGRDVGLEVFALGLVAGGAVLAVV